MTHIGFVQLVWCYDYSPPEKSPHSGGSMNPALIFRHHFTYSKLWVTLIMNRQPTHINIISITRAAIAKIKPRIFGRSQCLRFPSALPYKNAAPNKAIHMRQTNERTSLLSTERSNK
jgi:hypothetical protein